MLLMIQPQIHTYICKISVKDGFIWKTSAVYKQFIYIHTETVHYVLCLKSPSCLNFQVHSRLLEMVFLCV